MRLVVDLTRCQGYGQCAFLAPDVFVMQGQEALHFDSAPDEGQRERVLRAAAACPVQAIALDQVDLPNHHQRNGHRQNGYRTQESASRTDADDRLRSGRIVIVGASLAGLRAAEALRAEGFRGMLTLIGDETSHPYDRPPLSKQVLTGMVAPDHTALPRSRDVHAEWRLGVAATGLDLADKRVLLADGESVEFDRLLIATGVRARPWPNPTEAALDGVLGVRTPHDARQLRERLTAGPRRVLVIGAGFTGCEVASTCRELGVPVTVAEAGPAPLAGALGGALGAIAAGIQREHGVDLRCGVQVTALDGDGAGRLSRAHLSDGTVVDVDLAVAALGGIRNVEWLEGSGLAAGVWGVACDTGCRAFDVNGLVMDDVFVAGDVARTPHPLFAYTFLALEHWGNAVAQARVAAHNMVSVETARWPHLAVPEFWSTQFGHNIKSVGVPSFADQLAIVQGSIEERRFVAVYGHRGRLVAAVAFNQAMWLDHYKNLIEEAAPFPPGDATVGPAAPRQVVPADFPDRALPSHDATVVVTGHEPSERRARFVREQPLAGTASRR
jgi:NADPH-dependent 2,4-dienoyl-CoA reductase/sulfur reductase-like enzyme/ferredoxin